MYTCSRCDSVWTGKKQCHCGGEVGCHQTFSGEVNFDAHRVGRIPLSCVTPESLGMIQNARGIWRAQGEEDIWENRFGGQQ